MAVNIFYKNCSIPSSVRGADGLLKQASFCSSGDTASGAGVFGFVHLHALGGVLSEVRGF